jgi:hypothetical protein
MFMSFEEKATIMVPPKTITHERMIACTAVPLQVVIRQLCQDSFPSFPLFPIEIDEAIIGDATQETSSDPSR